MANVIILCPCCSSPKDATSGVDEQHFTCLACNQKWAMVVDADRVAQYSLT